MQQLDSFKVDNKHALAGPRNIPLRVRELVAGGVTHEAKRVGVGRFGSYFAVVNDGKPFGNLQKDIINVGNRSAHNAESVHKTGTKKALYNLMMTDDRPANFQNVAIILSKAADMEIKAMVVLFQKNSDPGLLEFSLNKHTADGGWELKPTEGKEALFSNYFGNSQWRSDIIELIPKFDESLQGWKVAFVLEKVTGVIDEVFQTHLSSTPLTVLGYCQHSYPRTESGDDHEPFCRSSSISPQFVSIGDVDISGSKAPWHCAPKSFAEVCVEGVRMQAKMFTADYIKPNCVDVGISYGRHVITSKMQSKSSAKKGKSFQGTLVMLQMPSYSTYTNTDWISNGVWSTEFTVEDVFQTSNRAGKFIQCLGDRSCLKVSSGEASFDIEVCRGGTVSGETPAIIQEVDNDKVRLQVSLSEIGPFFKSNPPPSDGVTIRFSLKPIFPISECKTCLDEVPWVNVKKAMGYDKLIEEHPWFNQPKEPFEEVKSRLEATVKVMHDPVMFEDFASKHTTKLMAWKIRKSGAIVLCPKMADVQTAPSGNSLYEYCHDLDMENNQIDALSTPTDQTKLGFILDCLDNYRNDKDLKHIQREGLGYEDTTIDNQQGMVWETFSNMRMPDWETDTGLLAHVYPNTAKHTDTAVINTHTEAGQKRKSKPVNRLIDQLAIETNEKPVNPAKKRVKTQDDATIQSHEKKIKAHEKTIKAHEKTIKAHEKTIKAQEQRIKEQDELLKQVQETLESAMDAQFHQPGYMNSHFELIQLLRKYHI